MSIEERLSKLEDIVKEMNERLSKVETILGNLLKESQKKIKKSEKRKITLMDLFITLKEDGFFDEPRKISDIAEELARRGYFYPTSSLTKPLIRSVRKGILGRLKKEGVWHYVKR